jgi:Nucleoside diphosphate kinase
MASGPVVAMVWQGLDAVKTGRAMLGATNPLASAPGSFTINAAPYLVLTAMIIRCALTQAPFVAISRSPSVATFAMAPTRSRMPRRRSNCQYCFYFVPRTPRNADVYHLTTPACSWFPEGVVQYNATLHHWIFE